MMPMWIEDAILGIMPEDSDIPAPNPAGQIDPSFFTGTLMEDNGIARLTNPPAPRAAGGGNYWRSMDRLMNALGSNRNWGNFALIDEEFNCIKALVSILHLSAPLETSSTDPCPRLGVRSLWYRLWESFIPTLSEEM